MEDWGAVKARLEKYSQWQDVQMQRDIRAALERVEELEREKYGTPCRCEQWVKACGEAEERAEAAEAKLARCVEALSAYVSQDAAFAEDHSTCGDCEWSMRYSRARAALAAARGE